MKKLTNLLLKGIIFMVEIALFFSFLISTLLGFCVAHYVIIPYIESRLKKRRQEFLKTLFKDLGKRNDN